MSDEEAVRARAHQIWEREGRPEGRAEDHWRKAVEELKHREEDRLDAPASPVSGAATSHQPGGTIPGGSPAVGMGSMGSGQAATGGAPTGTARRPKQ